MSPERDVSSKRRGSQTIFPQTTWKWRISGSVRITLGDSPRLNVQIQLLGVVAFLHLKSAKKSIILGSKIQVCHQFNCLGNSRSHQKLDRKRGACPKYICVDPQLHLNELPEFSVRQAFPCHPIYILLIHLICKIQIMSHRMNLIVKKRNLWREVKTI